MAQAGHDAALLELKKRMVNATEVTVKTRDPRKHQAEVADALKELKKQTKKSGLMQELRRREEYVPPAKARRLKAEASRKNARREEKRAAQNRKRDEF